MAGWTGVIVAVAVLTATAGAWLVRGRTDGRFRPVAGKPSPDPVLAALGVDGEADVTLLQFSSAFCAPCRTTRVLCSELAGRTPGVHHVDVDAESHLDAVRALGVWRTPTVLIVDGAGRIRRRAAGAPTRAQLAAAVRDVMAEPAG